MSGKLDPDNAGIEYTDLIIKYPEFEGVRWSWINNYYDGPLSGMVRHEGERYYAAIVWETDEYERVYALRKLDDKSQAQEDQRHADFVKYVGDHWDLETGVSTAKPASEHHKFYDKYDWRNPPEMTGEIVGWFSS